MLPAGIVADALPAEELGRFRAMLPAAQTVAHLKVGPCSCDLVRARQADARDDERHLRQRYARLGLSRDRIIRELERHRADVGRARAAGRMAKRARRVRRRARAERGTHAL